MLRSRQTLNAIKYNNLETSSLLLLLLLVSARFEPLNQPLYPHQTSQSSFHFSVTSSSAFISNLETTFQKPIASLIGFFSYNRSEKAYLLANPTMSLTSKLAITDCDLKDKRVLIRVCGPIIIVLLYGRSNCKE